MIAASLTSPIVQWLGKHSFVLNQAFNWLRDLSADTPDGIVPLGSPGFYGNVHAYSTREKAQCIWESHRQTIDVQVCLKGGEFVDWTEPRFLTPLGTYQEQQDLEEWISPQSISGQVILRPGSFAIFFAGEPHLPMIADGNPALIRKVVVKIPASLFEQEAGRNPFAKSETPE